MSSSFEVAPTLRRKIVLRILFVNELNHPGSIKICWLRTCFIYLRTCFIYFRFFFHVYHCIRSLNAHRFMPVSFVLPSHHKDHMYFTVHTILSILFSIIKVHIIICMYILLYVWAMSYLHLIQHSTMYVCLSICSDHLRTINRVRGGRWREEYFCITDVCPAEKPFFNVEVMHHSNRPIANWQNENHCQNEAKRHPYIHPSHPFVSVFIYW